MKHLQKLTRIAAANRHRSCLSAVFIRNKRLWLIVFLLLYALGQAQQPEQLIKEAWTNNPEIQQMEYQYQGTAEKVNEANSLPSTEFNVGVMAVKPEMNMPMANFRVSAMQMLPWFGTRDARKAYASSLADASAISIAIAKRKLALSVRSLYYQLYALQAKQKVLNNHIALLTTYEEMALTGVEVGKASAVEVLRLQIRQNELKQQKAILQQEYQGMQAGLNAQLNRAANASLLIVDTLALPEEDTIYAIDGLAVNPELLQYDKWYASVSQAETLNQQERKPKWGIGLEYINQEDSPMITSSHKDMLMPMFSLKVPLFNAPHASKTKQNELQQQALESEKQVKHNKLKSLWVQALAKREQARIRYTTQQKNLAQAERAMQILLKTYETGSIDFNDVLDLQSLQLDFEMQQIESVKDYYLEQANLNYLIP